MLDVDWGITARVLLVNSRGELLGIRSRSLALIFQQQRTGNASSPDGLRRLRLINGIQRLGCGLRVEADHAEDCWPEFFRFLLLTRQMMKLKYPPVERTEREPPL